MATTIISIPARIRPTPRPRLEVGRGADRSATGSRKLRYLFAACILLAAFGLASLALLSGVDRLGLSDARTAANKPAFISPVAARSLARMALTKGQPDQAEIWARRAVMAEPLDPGSSALLGAALFAQGHLARADDAFLVAGRLGWRDPITQLYWMQVALNRDETEIAAQRLDAVLRQVPAFPQADQLLNQFTNNEAGRRALAVRLSLRPSWLTAFVKPNAGIDPKQFRERALVLGLLGPQALKCDEVATLIDRLAQQGDVEQGLAIWRLACSARNGQGLMSDPGFAEATLGQQRTVFDWSFPADANLSVELLPGASETQELRARVTAASSRAVTQQLLVLPPGGYRLSWSAKDDSGASVGRFAASLGCGTPQAGGTPGTLVDQKQARFAVDLDADPGCPGQLLVLWLAPGSGAILRNLQLVRR